MNIAIVDDDKNQCDFLSHEVNLWANKRELVTCVNTYPSAESFWFEFAENNDFDIVLLDIEMPGMNGMELAHKLRAENAMLQIIFVTGYSDYISEG